MNFTENNYNTFLHEKQELLNENPNSKILKNLIKTRIKEIDDWITEYTSQLQNKKSKTISLPHRCDEGCKWRGCK